MSLFFGLLPTDLQVHVLHGWIHNKQDVCELLKPLFILDMVCPKAHQAAFRITISQIPAFGERLEVMTRTPIRSVSGYLHWLSGRKVAIRSLLLRLDGAPFEELVLASNLSLPPVESLTLLSAETICSDLVEALLRICPNITHLTIQECTFSPALAALAPKLTSVSIASLLSHEVFETMLTVLGSQLHELRMPCGHLTEPLVKVLCDTCPLLQTLETVVIPFKVNACRLLLQSCKLLSSLVLHSMDASEADAAAIADMAIAFPQLKRLTVKGKFSPRSGCVVLTAVQSRRPDMEHLEIKGWRYTAAEGILNMDLSFAGFEPALVASVLDVCPVVKVLEMSGAVLGGELAEVIVEHLQGNLQTVYLVVNNADAVGMIMRKFGKSLKDITLVGAGCTNELLQLVATQCPLLESIGLKTCLNASDEGVISLLTSCPQLKEVSWSTFPITVATLQAIVNKRLRLKMLQVNFCCGLDGSHKNWFKQQLKDHQLLTVPVMEIIC